MPSSRSQTVSDATLLGAAEQILHSDGPHALSLRHIADRVGTSTQAVYTLFGGKAGLADSLFREGFSRLDERLSSVDRDLDPIERIRALSAAYRDNAFENPHLYDVMTARPLAEYEPPPDSRRLARATLQPLIDAVADAVEAGVLHGDAREIAQQMWAAGHGFVSLVIHGLDTTDDAHDRYADLTETMIAGHRPTGSVELRQYG